MQALARLAAAPLELFALDLEPGEAGCTLYLRLGGSSEIIAERLERLKKALSGAGANPQEIQVFEGDAEAELWRSHREFSWLKPMTNW
jgi:hypothetical protein